MSYRLFIMNNAKFKNNIAKCLNTLAILLFSFFCYLASAEADRLHYLSAQRDVIKKFTPEMKVNFKKREQPSLERLEKNVLTIQLQTPTSLVDVTNVQQKTTGIIRDVNNIEHAQLRSQKKSWQALQQQISIAESNSVTVDKLVQRVKNDENSVALLHEISNRLDTGTLASKEIERLYSRNHSIKDEVVRQDNTARYQIEEGGKGVQVDNDNQTLLSSLIVLLLIFVGYFLFSRLKAKRYT